MDVLHEAWKILMHSLWYAFLVGGLPMIVWTIDEIVKENKAKKRRKARQKREEVKHEETSEYVSKRTG
jgi:phosphopantetheine adenylyltransferase